MDEVDGYAMQNGVVLILVRDVLGAGLFAALAEGAALEPAFAFPGERADTATERLRPSRVLLECYHPAARSDQFFAVAALHRCRVILFAPAAPWVDCEQIARSRGVTVFVHPAPGESLAELVAAALAE